MASLVPVPLFRNGVFWCGCFKTSFKSSNTATSLSSDEYYVICTSFGKNSAASDILVMFVSGT